MSVPENLEGSQGGLFVEIKNSLSKGNTILIEFFKDAVVAGYPDSSVEIPPHGCNDLLGEMSLAGVIAYIEDFLKNRNKNFGYGLIIIPRKNALTKVYQSGKPVLLKSPRRQKKIQDGVTTLLEEKGDYTFPESLIPDGTILGNMLKEMMTDEFIHEGGTFVILTDEFMTPEQKIGWLKLSIEQRQSWWNFMYARIQKPFFEETGLTLSCKECNGFPELSLNDTAKKFPSLPSSISVSLPHSDPRSFH